MYGGSSFLLVLKIHESLCDTILHKQLNSYNHNLNGEDPLTMLEQKSPGSDQRIVVEQGTLFDKAELERLKLQRMHWEDTAVQQSQKRMPERDNLITTSGVPIDRIYTPQDN